MPSLTPQTKLKTSKSDNIMSAESLLVFPVSTPLGLDYMKSCIEKNISVVGASSDENDPTGGIVQWERLPLIHSEEFFGAFYDFVNRFRVKKIYAAAHMVHKGLIDTLKNHPELDIEIVNESPLDEYFTRWNKTFDRAKNWQKIISELQPEKEKFSETFLAGVIYHAFNIFGESYDEKLAALLSCLTDAPDGDIVEIGTLFGRSLSVLISGRELGSISRNVFVFDPWSSDIGLQKDLPDNLQNYTQKCGIENIPKIFESIFSVFSDSKSLAAYRCSSADGFSIYTKSGFNNSCSVLKKNQNIDPKGKIALLHIDGNHDLESVSLDVDFWSQLVLPGGWLVLDDYEWRYGNGPKVVGDKLKERWRNDINKCFVKGGCLFIQKKYQK